MRYLIAVLTLLASAQLCLAATIHVPTNQPTIQEGIDAAGNGDTVIVACDVYNEYEISIYDIVGLVLMSETGEPDCVTIDAQQLGQVLFCHTVDSTTEIVGFTLTGGQNDAHGGGVHLQHSSPVFENCVIADNAADAGGGVFCTNSSSPRFLQCAIVDNTANSGGGVWSHEALEMTFIDCEISGNHSEYEGGGLKLLSPATLEGCTIAGNSGILGGGIFCWNSSLTLHQCTITGNRVEPDGSGGGLYINDGSTPVIKYCTIAGNYSDSWAGGVFFGPSCVADVDNVIVWGNCAAWGEQVYADFGSTTDFECCCVDLNGVEGAGVVVWSGFNSPVDPFFCGPEDCENAPTQDGDYTINAMSICAAANNPCQEKIGSQEVGCSWFCGDCNGDGTANITDAVYLITYIFAGGPAPDPLAAGDVNCDGTPNISDAVYLIQYIFGGGPPPCDPDGDGEPDC
jgi:hypothetical protein